MTAAFPMVIYLGPPEMLDHVRASLPTGLEVRLPADEADFDRLLPECEAVLDASMRVKFTEARIARASRLKWYVTATTGADHVDGAALAAKGVPLLTLRGRGDVLNNITAAAEHSWLLLLACARGLRGAVDDVLADSWDRTRHPGTMLNGKTIGIIGCGRIGGWMSRYAQAFGMTCVGFDPHLKVFPNTIKSVPLDELLRKADFLTVHVPLQDDTRNLLGQPQFDLMKTGVVLVNTSRGEIIDQEALLRALESGRVGAAGLDVVTGEPDISAHPLLEYARRHRNLIITPHIGGFSPDAVRLVLEFSCRRIGSLLATGRDV